MTKWTTEQLASQAGTLTVTGHMPVGKTSVHHANQTVMVFHPDGRLEFPQMETYPDSVKAAAKVLCEDVSMVHKALAHENARLEARIKRLEEALRPFADEASKWGEFVDDEPLVEGWSDGPDSKLSVGDLRRARAALEDK